MKRFISILLLSISMIQIVGCSTDQVVAYCISYNNESYTYEDLDTLEEKIEKQQEQMKAAHTMAEAARALGYEEDNSIILVAQQEYQTAQLLYEDYRTIYDDLKQHWQKKEKEYGTATYIWSYLKDQGYSDVVVAGIIGNMMVEVGGYTLDLDWNIQTKSYYGICQWNKTYSQVWRASLEEQCKFLQSTIQDEFNTYGYMYKKNFKYNDFLNLETPQTTALAFAKSYERCDSSTYKMRQNCAIEAYNYFIS